MIEISSKYLDEPCKLFPFVPRGRGETALYVVLLSGHLHKSCQPCPGFIKTVHGTYIFSLTMDVNFQLKSGL